MSRLSDLYKAMETLRKEGLSLNEDLRITGRFFDPLKMAESITDLRIHESTDSRK